MTSQIVEERMDWDGSILDLHNCGKNRPNILFRIAEKCAMSYRPAVLMIGERDDADLTLFLFFRRFFLFQCSRQKKCAG